MTSSDTVVSFFFKFHVMLSNGIPLVASLRRLAAEEDNPDFSKVIEEIAEGVKAGTVLSKTMRAHGGWFDEAVIDVLATGERHGILDVMTGVIPQILLFRRLEDWKK